MLPKNCFQTKYRWMHYRMVGRQRWRRRRTRSRMRVTEEGYIVIENGGDEVNALVPVCVAVSTIMLGGGGGRMKRSD
jgi:hypothetical protein